MYAFRLKELYPFYRIICTFINARNNEFEEEDSYILLLYVEETSFSPCALSSVFWSYSANSIFNYNGKFTSRAHFLARIIQINVKHLQRNTLFKRTRHFIVLWSRRTWSGWPCSFANITNKYFAVHKINVILNSFIYLKVFKHFDEHTNITILVTDSVCAVK